MRPRDGTVLASLGAAQRVDADGVTLTGTDPSSDALLPRRFSGPWPHAVALIIATAMIRAIVGVIVPLFPDETYYWGWSRHLAAGYFDHPPAIALLIRLGTLLEGDTTLGVRLVPLIVGAITSLSVLLIARSIGDDSAARRAAILLACLPVAAGGLGLATPDAPLLAMLGVSLFAVVRATSSPVRSVSSLMWWLAGGAALGGALVSKYTAVLLPVAVLVALATNRKLRPHLAAPGPYAALAVALLVVSPVILWNAHHDWISFRFQIAHGLGTPHGSAIVRELKLLGTQMGLASPLLFAVMIAATAAALRHPRGGPHFMLAVVAMVSIGFFALSALRRPVQSNWPSIFYIPASALVAVSAGERRWNRWFKVACGLGGVCVLALYAQAAFPLLPLEPSKDPIARAHGWDALATQVSALSDNLSVDESRRPWVASDRYEDASELAFHLTDHPPVLSVNLVRRPNQYDLWPGFADLARRGDDLVLVLGVAPDPHPLVETLRAHFDSLRPVGRVSLRRGAGIIRTRQVWLFDGWRGSWPPRRPDVAQSVVIRPTSTWR